ncbi:MAG: hypothetical protein ACLTSZ_03355 [Lachnospiraceae bacterium]
MHGHVLKEVVEGLVLLFTAKATDSFPSRPDHAGSSFAAATAICCTQKASRWRWLTSGACHPGMGFYEAVHCRNSLSDGCAGGRTDRRTVRRGGLYSDEALPDGLDGA